MRPDTPKLLEDIRDAGSFILSSIAGRTLEQFEADRLLRQAVERNFEIIGEALRRISLTDTDVATQIGDTRRIIDFRNLIIHGYDRIDYEVVWLIIQEKLSPLISRVEALLKNAQ
ncbi:MAG TPA: DUF86 domain-containing protein [bacterium]|nr:DUF86 domain-containing protein [bacterium]